jgi:hypothetical protein
MSEGELGGEPACHHWRSKGRKRSHVRKSKGRKRKKRGRSKQAEDVRIADIESLGNGHLTTLVTGNTAMIVTVSTMLRQKDKDTGKCQDKL